jgi:glycerol-3-phosphate acyltransferase PlsY
MVDPISFWGQLPYYAVSVIVGYLLGSIPFGVIFTRLAGLGDVRSIGSGNIGATNVLRTGNKWLAAATLVTDGAKGGVAVLLMWHFWGVDHAVLAGAGAFLGHVFPVWLGFRGGKGVATFWGISLALNWPAGLVFAATWLFMAILFRRSSLAALVGSVAVVAFLWIEAWYQFAELTAFLTILIWWAHRANIGRLLRGEEPRIGAKKA